MSLLETKDLRVAFGKDVILQDVSFSLDRGDTVAVIGPNGSGKTTLLRAILGVVPFEGELRWGERARLGYVPQKLDLERDLPLNVEEFLSLHPQLKEQKEGYSPQQILQMVGLGAEFLKKNIALLSAGHFQRVLIAFALITKPDILLFDEPTASIDVAGEETVYELLHRLQEAQRFALILVSHDLTIVYQYAHKVLCLNKAQICFGVPREVLTPDELEKLYGGGKKFYQHAHIQTQIP